MSGGLAARPDSTLVDRALLALAQEARPAGWLAAHVMGLTRAPELVAERLAMALLGADPRAQRLADGRWSLVAAASGAPPRARAARTRRARGSILLPVGRTTGQ